MERVTELFPEAGGVIRPAIIKTTGAVLRRPAEKLALVLYDCFCDEYKAGDVGARDSENTQKLKNFRTL